MKDLDPKIIDLFGELAKQINQLNESFQNFYGEIQKPRCETCKNDGLYCPDCSKPENKETTA